MGMSGHPDCIPKLLELAEDDSTPGYTRVKAIEALGRLRAAAAAPLMQEMMEAKQLWRWKYPDEERIAAAQSLMRIDAVMAMQKTHAQWLRSQGFDFGTHRSRSECFGDPAEALRGALKLSRNVIAVTTNLRENIRLSIPEMNLGGGIGAGDRHLAPGSLLTLKLTHGVRHIKAQAVVRGARPQAMAFEFVEMDLDERSRLRKLLLELGGLPLPAQASNRTRRRGRVAMMRN